MDPSLSSSSQHFLRSKASMDRRCPVKKERKRRWWWRAFRVVARAVVYSALLAASLAIGALCLPVRGPFLGRWMARKLTALAPGVEIGAGRVALDFSRGSLSIDYPSATMPATGERVAAEKITIWFDPIAALEGRLPETPLVVELKRLDPACWKKNTEGILACASGHGHVVDALKEAFAKGAGGERKGGFEEVELRVRDLEVSYERGGAEGAVDGAPARSERLILDSITLRPAGRRADLDFAIVGSAGGGATGRASIAERGGRWRVAADVDPFAFHSFAPLAGGSKGTLLAHVAVDPESKRAEGTIEIAIGELLIDPGAAGSDPDATGPMELGDATLALAFALEGATGAFDASANLDAPGLVAKGSASRSFDDAGEATAKARLELSRLSGDLAKRFLAIPAAEGVWRVALDRDAPLVAELATKGSDFASFDFALSSPAEAIATATSPRGGAWPVRLDARLEAKRPAADAPATLRLARPLQAWLGEERLAVVAPFEATLRRLSAAEIAARPAARAWEPVKAFDVALESTLTPRLAALFLPPEIERELLPWRPTGAVEARGRVRFEPGGGVEPFGELSFRDASLTIPSEHVAAPLKIASGKLLVDDRRIELQAIEASLAGIAASVNGLVENGRAVARAEIRADLSTLEDAFPIVLKDEHFIGGEGVGFGLFTAGEETDEPIPLADTLRVLAVRLRAGDFRYRAEAKTENGRYFHASMPQSIDNIRTKAVFEDLALRFEEGTADAGNSRDAKIAGTIQFRPGDFPRLAFQIHAPKANIGDWMGPWFPTPTKPSDSPRDPSNKKKFELLIELTANSWYARDFLGAPIELRGGRLDGRVKFTFAPGAAHPGQLRILPGSKLDLYGGPATLEGMLYLPTHPRGGGPEKPGRMELIWRADNVSLSDLADGLRGEAGELRGRLSAAGFARGPLGDAARARDFLGAARFSVARSNLLASPWVNFFTSVLTLDAQKETEARGTILLHKGLAWTTNVVASQPILTLALDGKIALDGGKLDGRVQVRSANAAYFQMVGLKQLAGLVDSLSNQALALTLEGTVKQPVAATRPIASMMSDAISYPCPSDAADKFPFPIPQRLKGVDWTAAGRGLAKAP
jgi:hypothetical protein